MVVRHRLGCAQPAIEPAYGFQVTFFRSRTGLAADNPQPLRGAAAAVRACRGDRPGRAAPPPRPAHRALVGRAGAGAGPGLDRATPTCGSGRWSLQRATARRRCALASVDGPHGFRLRPARCARTQPLLLQGDAGFSRKGPDEAPGQPLLQRAAAGGARHAGRATAAAACTRRAAAPGSTTNGATSSCTPTPWAGTGSASTWSTAARSPPSCCAAATAARCGPAAASRAAGSRHASSPPTKCASNPAAAGAARRPPPATRCSGRCTRRPGAGEVRALMDAQELDSRGSTGTVYWEGLSELLDAQRPARRAGLPGDDRLRRRRCGCDGWRPPPAQAAARGRPRPPTAAAAAERQGRGCCRGVRRSSRPDPGRRSRPASTGAARTQLPPACRAAASASWASSISDCRFGCAGRRCATPTLTVMRSGWSAERSVQPLGALADALGHVQRAGGVGLRQEDGHLAVGDSGSARRRRAAWRRYWRSRSAQHGVAGGGAAAVAQALVTVDVDQQQGRAGAVAARRAPIRVRPTARRARAASRRSRPATARSASALRRGSAAASPSFSASAASGRAAAATPSTAPHNAAQGAAAPSPASSTRALPAASRPRTAPAAARPRPAAGAGPEALRRRRLRRGWRREAGSNGAHGAAGTHEPVFDHIRPV